MTADMTLGESPAEPQVGVSRIGNSGPDSSVFGMICHWARCHLPLCLAYTCLTFFVNFVRGSEFSCLLI